jgi:multicomponent Na+:H+ antiporter subunit G
MADYLTAFLLVSGGAFACIAGLGLVRMPDVYIRMHAATKAGTLGAGLILAAVAVHFAETGVVVRALAAIAFLLLTAPVAAHMIGRAAYRTGVPLWEASVIDEWKGRPQPDMEPEITRQERKT